MQKTLVAISIVALFVGVALVPVGTSQIPDVDFSLGVTYFEDFDADEGDWTANTYEVPGRPDPDSTWGWGEPTSGPGAAASGTKAWATNLAGDYARDECGAIMSPPIDLSNATSASVSVTQWRDMAAGSFYSYAAGMFFVTADGGDTLTVVDPAGGYDERMYFDVRTCMDGSGFSQRAFTGTSTEYETSTVDLSAFAGETVQFVMAFASRDSSRYSGAGWYVDDFTVTKDGVSVVEDFESTDGGFTLVSTAPVPLYPIGWEYGAAGVGPGTDSPLWGTNLDGKYGPGECSWVESPTFMVGEHPGELAVAGYTATLTWLQWFKTHSGVGAGVVQVGDGSGTYTNVVPTSGYSETRFLKDEHEACLEYESQGSGAFAGSLNAEGGDMTEYAADLTPWLGQEITLRFLFATQEGTSLMNTGWYVDDVAVELSITHEAPNVEDQLPALPGSSSDAPGWSSGGELSTWEYGVASSGPEGETVYATNLAGDHAERECSYLDSPSFPGALLAVDPTLTVDHYWEMYRSSFSGPWAAGVILVSTDDGATWSYLEDVDGYTDAVTTSVIDDCFVDAGIQYPIPGGFGGASSGFETATADLSAFADAPTVKVRFMFGGYILERPGWYIRSVSVGGAPLLG